MKDDGELPCRVKVRHSQRLNNLVEHDHRRVTQRSGLILGFKRFDNAVITISGIELAEKIKVNVSLRRANAAGSMRRWTELWNAALAA